MASFVLGALSLEVLVTSAGVTLELYSVLADGIAMATKSFSGSVGPMALFLVIKIHLHFLVRQALVSEPTLGESLSFGELSFT